jgi:ABC-type sugar transport system permease subunit
MKSMRPYLFILPAFVLFLLFTLWPLGELLALSVYKTDYITRTFVGLENYKEVLASPVAAQAAFNSLVYAVLLVILQVGIAVLIVLLLFGLAKFWVDFARVAFYAPMLGAGLVLSATWRWVFARNGVANFLLGLFGIAPIAWFGQAVTGIPVITIILALSSFGGPLLLLFASLASLDKGIVEAAWIDGASLGQIKRHIVLPHLAPAIYICCFLSASGAPQIFEYLNFLSPYDYTATLTYQIYTQAFRLGQYGFAAAMTVLTTVLLLLLALTQKKVVDRG